jgi:hypothetical protein
MVKKKGKRLSTILQPSDVSNKSASFDGKKKMLRCSFIPAFKDLFSRETIKRYIQFYGVKKLGVVFEPFFLGKIRGIEDSVPPMGIVIAACSDENHNKKGSRIRGSVGSGLLL